MWTDRPAAHESHRTGPWVRRAALPILLRWLAALLLVVLLFAAWRVGTAEVMYDAMIEWSRHLYY